MLSQGDELVTKLTAPSGIPCAQGFCRVSYVLDTWHDLGRSEVLRSYVLFLLVTVLLLLRDTMATATLIKEST